MCAPFEFVIKDCLNGVHSDEYQQPFTQSLRRRARRQRARTGLSFARELPGGGLGPRPQLLTHARAIPTRLAEQARVLGPDDQQRIEREAEALVPDPLETARQAPAQLLRGARELSRLSHAA